MGAPMEFPGQREIPGGGRLGRATVRTVGVLAVLVGALVMGGGSAAAADTVPISGPVDFVPISAPAGLLGIGASFNWFAR